MSMLDRKKFGMVLRTFAKTYEQVEKNATMALSAARKAEAIEKGGKPLYAKVLILIPRDQSYADCDCGETLAFLKRFIEPGSRIEVHEVENGDLFCGLLNYGVAKLARFGCDYVTIMSPGAASYLSLEEMERAGVAFEHGARVSAIAIDELAASVLEGRVANTLATWDTVALQTVGAFDLRASQPRQNDPTAPYVRGYDLTEGKEVFYAQAGVEEIIPLIRLVQLFGECIAPMSPLTPSTWEVPDSVTDPEGYQRHLKKLGTKFERQMIHAAYVNADLSVIQGGVMKRYRTF